MLCLSILSICDVVPEKGRHFMPGTDNKVEIHFRGCNLSVIIQNFQLYHYMVSNLLPRTCAGTNL
jgi:hypothetical protein